MMELEEAVRPQVSRSSGELAASVVALVRAPYMLLRALVLATFMKDEPSHCTEHRQDDY